MQEILREQEGKVLFTCLFMVTPKDPCGLLPLDELLEKLVC